MTPNRHLTPTRAVAKDGKLPRHETEGSPRSFNQKAESGKDFLNKV
jgi:hypothetical protein